MADVLSIGVKAGGKLYPAGTPLADLPQDVLTDEDAQRLDAYVVTEEEQREAAEGYDNRPGAALSTMRSEYNMTLTEQLEAGDFENGATSPDGGKEQNPSVGNALTPDDVLVDPSTEPDTDPNAVSNPSPGGDGDPAAGLDTVDPDDYSRDDLVAMAEGKGLSVPSGATKADIADLINGADEE